MELVQYLLDNRAFAVKKILKNFNTFYIKKIRNYSHKSFAKLGKSVLPFI